MWIELKLPRLCNRIIGFSLPCEDFLYVMSSEALHHVRLGLQSTVTHDPGHAEDYEIFDTETNELTFKGVTLPMFGENGGTPIVKHPLGMTLRRGAAGKVGPTGESLESFDVLDPAGKILRTITFADTSGDWCYGTFSRDGGYLLIGVPYALHVYQWVNR